MSVQGAVAAVRRGEHLQKEPGRSSKEVPPELSREPESPGWGRWRRDSLVAVWQLPNE